MEMEVIVKEDECHGEKVEDGKQLPKANIKGKRYDSATQDMLKL